MPVPKKKPSKARTRRRRSANTKLTLRGLSTCGNCGAVKLPHFICMKCGFYKGKSIMDVERFSHKVKNL